MLGLVSLASGRAGNCMRALLTIVAMSVLFLGISLPGRTKLEGSAEVRSQDKRSPETVKAKPNEAAKNYACSEAANRARAKQSGEKEPDRPDSTTNAEFCLELRRPPSAVQECVRSILQAKGWTVPATKTDEAGMMATRQLTSEEVRRVSHAEIAGGQMQWEGGGAYAQIRLVSQSTGGTQVRMGTRILAKGSTALPLERVSPWTPLVSKGVLESEVLAALAVQCSAKR